MDSLPSLVHEIFVRLKLIDHVIFLEVTSMNRKYSSFLQEKYQNSHHGGYGDVGG